MLFSFRPSSTHEKEHSSKTFWCWCRVTVMGIEVEWIFFVFVCFFSQRKTLVRFQRRKTTNKAKNQFFVAFAKRSRWNKRIKIERKIYRNRCQWNLIDFQCVCGCGKKIRYQPLNLKSQPLFVAELLTHCASLSGNRSCRLWLREDAVCAIIESSWIKCVIKLIG